MVGMISMQNHFKKAFSAEQAEVLATAIVEAHDQLVTRRDFHELKDVVERLAKSQERTEGRMDRLAAAQERTEERMDRLAAAQERTEGRMDRLAAAQERTEERMDRLAAAQERTEERMEQLAAAQKRTESEIHELFIAQKELTWTMKDVHKQLGGLALSVGHGLEAYAMERIQRILAQYCGFETESSAPETIEADGRGRDIDIVCRGTVAGRPAAILCEVKTNINRHEVEAFLEVFERVRPQIARDEQINPADIHPLFFGYRASSETCKLIASRGAWLAFPRGLIVAER